MSISPFRLCFSGFAATMILLSGCSSQEASNAPAKPASEATINAASPEAAAALHNGKPTQAGADWVRQHAPGGGGSR